MSDAGMPETVVDRMKPAFFQRRVFYQIFLDMDYVGTILNYLLKIEPS